LTIVFTYISVHFYFICFSLQWSYKLEKELELNKELEKLRFDFRYKLAAIIQLPGLKVVFHTHETTQAMELRKKLTLSAKVEEVSRFGENEIRVTICRIPPQFNNDEIADDLKIYSEVIKINALTDRYGIQIGKRHVFFKKNTMTEIPRCLTKGGGYKSWLTKLTNPPSLNM